MKLNNNHIFIFLFPFLSVNAKGKTTQTDREYWASLAYKIMLPLAFL